MDTATFYIIVVFIITLVIIAAGVYLILILHEAHRSLQRINSILNRIDNLSNFFENKVLRPGTNFVGIISVAREAFELVDQLKSTLRSKKGNEV